MPRRLVLAACANLRAADELGAPFENVLTIGIDARAAVEVAAGRGRVVRELLRALAAREDAHTYRCYARTRWEEPLDARFQWREIGARDPLWHLRAARAAQRECDVFLSSNSYLTPLFMRTPAVAIDPAFIGQIAQHTLERGTIGILGAEGARDFADADLAAAFADEGDKFLA